MKSSELINELASALSKAQGEMKDATKVAINPFFKSKYAPLDKVFEQLRPVFSKNGLSITQICSETETHIYLETVLMHSSGQWLSSSLKISPSKNDAQGVGSAITYARRYSLSAIAGIASEDDDDGNSASGKDGNTQSKKESKDKETTEDCKTIENLSVEITEVEDKPKYSNITYIETATGLITKAFCADASIIETAKGFIGAKEPTFIDIETRGDKTKIVKILPF